MVKRQIKKHYVVKTPTVGRVYTSEYLNEHIKDWYFGKWWTSTTWDSRKVVRVCDTLIEGFNRKVVVLSGCDDHCYKPYEYFK